MKALEFLKDIRNDCPEEWKTLDEAIEELENLKHNYEMQQILIDDYKIFIKKINKILDRIRNIAAV